MGPTASGKTGLALSLAERLPVEIVSVDSAQVYRGMDIGTAKPAPEVRARVPHHLIDLLDPAETYSAARFREDALQRITAIRERGRIPLLAGGTMLYFHTLRQGLSELPGADAEVRARLATEARRHGWPWLHEKLAQLDPETAARLHPNDAQRIRPPSRVQGRRGGARIPEPVLPLALYPGDRKALHERIRHRFMEMMQQGFLEEVRALHARGDLAPDLPSIRAVGYRQLWGHLDGEYDLQTAIERGIAATRQLAKRQLTWLRADANAERFEPSDPRLLEHVEERIHAAAVQAAAC
jgi:tRNA dimethylallyltransferase